METLLHPSALQGWISNGFIHRQLGRAPKGVAGSIESFGVLGRLHPAAHLTALALPWGLLRSMRATRLQASAAGQMFGGQNDAQVRNDVRQYGHSEPAPLHCQQPPTPGSGE